jgi:tetratricopeptide (TPR) repeat protein
MKVGKLLYKAKSYRDAERAFEVVAPVLKDFDSYDFYARALHRNGRKEEALQYYRQAHMKQKDGDIAFNIGTLLAAKAERDPTYAQEAISFLLEASFLSETNSKKAMELAEFLFFTVNKDLKFNENVQEIQKINNKLQELTNTFNTKFGEKDEEDLTDAEKKEMEALRAQIDAGQKALQKLEAAQKMSLDRFNALIEKTKQRLDIK